MLEKYVADKILANFGFEPTRQQVDLINLLSVFITNREERSLFLLKGFAGTGKTTVIGALVKAFLEMEQMIVLSAPTGRAARVLSLYAGIQAHTIHKLIYRQSKPEIGGAFEIAYNKAKNTLFVVDEASMLADSGEKIFGSGNLLDDLIQFVYQGENCRLLLLGDTAQLPPVMCEESPALDVRSLETFGLTITEYTLTQVVRQAKESGILQNATRLRMLIDNPQAVAFKEFNDVIRVDGMNFLECMENSYREVGEDETIVITRSNKRAGMYANGIRGRILYREDVLSNGDLLMIVKNNYTVGLPYGLDFIANGDVAELIRTRGARTIYGCSFREVSLHLVDYNMDIDALFLEDSLLSETPFDLQELNKRLYDAVMEDYAEIRNKRERYKKMRDNPYLNAIQAKSAYAVTCHKAQGGQWKHVYIDMGLITADKMDKSFVRWLYTSVTRATEKLYLINFPDTFFVK